MFKFRKRTKRYTKCFRNIETGLEYFVTGCHVVEGETQHLVLFNEAKRSTVEVDDRYELTGVIRVPNLEGELIELTFEQFNKKFKEVN